MSLVLRSVLTVCLVAGLAANAKAGMIGFNWTIGGNPNVPVMSLTNTSTTAQITGYSVTIGNTNFNWDSASVLSLGGLSSATLNNPDAFNQAARADIIDYSFTGFDAGETFQHNGDVDRDNFDTLGDYRIVLFNNGNAQNSVITVDFSTGDSIAVGIPDFDRNRQSFSLGGSRNVNVVPEPSALSLWCLGAVSFATIRRRRALRK